MPSLPHPACTRGCRSRRIPHRVPAGRGGRRPPQGRPTRTAPGRLSHSRAPSPRPAAAEQAHAATPPYPAVCRDTHKVAALTDRHTATLGYTLACAPHLARQLRPARGPAKALSHTHTQRARTARAHTRQPTGRRGADEPPRQTEGKTNETRQDNLRRSPRRNAHVYTCAPYSLPACHSRLLFGGHEPSRGAGRKRVPPRRLLEGPPPQSKLMRRPPPTRPAAAEQAQAADPHRLPAHRG